MFFRRFVSVVLTLVMLCSAVAFAEGETANLISPNPAADGTTPVPTQEEINKAATGFTDIAADAPYAAAVKKLVDNGIISGYPDGSFRPMGEVTRAEMCKMINLTLGYTDSEGAAGFPDVAETNWYYAFALAAQKQGYVKGYEDGTFRGSNNITRQEMCAILDRLLKPMNLGIPVRITDPVANWARPHVELIIQNFIMPLEEKDTFRATENLKRHELASVLSNMNIGPVKQIDAEVRFFVDGKQYGETQTVLVGECAIAPADPPVTTDGYVFEGWRPVGTPDPVDVNTVFVSENVDFEAVFMPKLYEVTFYSKGAIYETRKIAHGASVMTITDPAEKGYSFLGWSLTDGGKTVKLPDIKITDNISFYAVYEKQESGGGGGFGGGDVVKEYHRVIFWFDGEVIKDDEVAEGSSAKAPSTRKYEENLEAGYVFVGWSYYDDNDPEGVIDDLSDIKINKPMDFYSVIVENPNSEEFMEKLTRGYDQLGGIQTTGLMKTAIKETRSCIGKVLNDAKRGIEIDKQYVYDEYTSSVKKVKEIINSRMTSTERSQFANIITNRVDEDVREFLIEYFDITM